MDEGRLYGGLLRILPQPDAERQHIGGFGLPLILQMVATLALRLFLIYPRAFECLFRYGFSWRYVAPWGWFTPLVSGTAMLVVLHLQLTFAPHLPGGQTLTALKFQHTPISVWVLIAIVLGVQLLQMVLTYRGVRYPPEDGQTALYSGVSFLYRLTCLRNAYPHSWLNHLIQLVVEPALLIAVFYVFWSPSVLATVEAYGLELLRYDARMLWLAGIGMAFLKATQYVYFFWPVKRGRRFAERLQKKEFKRAQKDLVKRRRRGG